MDRRADVVFASFTFSFINTVAGWINLLLLSSSGPVKIPVGAW
jgi:3-oxoacyl-(acyl-carrier-protein) synthase